MPSAPLILPRRAHARGPATQAQPIASRVAAQTAPPKAPTTTDQDSDSPDESPPPLSPPVAFVPGGGGAGDGIVVRL
eukprot:2754469-Prymnesium_polylepis.2